MSAQLQAPMFCSRLARTSGHSQRAVGSLVSSDGSDAGRLKQFPVLRPLVTTGVHLRAGRPLLAVAGSGGVAHQLPEHAVALAALVDAVLAALGV
jgi:hypothetical protein